MENANDDSQFAIIDENANDYRCIEVDIEGLTLVQSHLGYGRTIENGSVKAFGETLYKMKFHKNIGSLDGKECIVFIIVKDQDNNEHTVIVRMKYGNTKFFRISRSEMRGEFQVDTFEKNNYLRLQIYKGKKKLSHQEMLAQEKRLMKKLYE